MGQEAVRHAAPLNRNVIVETYAVLERALRERGMNTEVALAGELRDAHLKTFDLLVSAVMAGFDAADKISELGESRS